MVRSSEYAAATSATATDGASGGMRTYTNAAFHFSLAYPSDLSVYEYNEARTDQSYFKTIKRMSAFRYI
jgi:hypothetical protein